MRVPERVVICHACGARHRFEDMVPRRAECERCRESLHSCRNCTFYDVSAYNECRETSAERVVDKIAANFCDFFQPAAGGAKAAAPAASAPLDDLERLFKKS
jgi:hypothetical protein